MTVARDKRDSWKYEELVFVEFLEAFCRIALCEQHPDHTTYPMNDEEKVFHLLEKFHEKAVIKYIIDSDIIVLMPIAN